MLGFQIFYQRRRKLLTRSGALLVIGLGGLLTVLPRADAHDPMLTVALRAGAEESLLLSPQPMSGERFAAFYALERR